MKDFAGYHIWSSAFPHLNGKVVEKTIRKAFPEDNESTLYIVKVGGIRGRQQLYEDEMF